MNILFFGSTSDSAIVLHKLKAFITMKQSGNITISSVVTQQPKPIGRKQILTPTPVEAWARKNKFPVLSFATDREKPWLYQDENEVNKKLTSLDYDLIVSASYGQKIPDEVVKKAKFGSLNVHPSLLPRWRGADPVPWAILSGDEATGASVVTISEKFDQGQILAQKKVKLNGDEYPDPLRTKLFELGAELLIGILQKIQKIEKYPDVPTPSLSENYARRFTRDDGYIPWEIIKKSINSQLSNIKTKPSSTSHSGESGLSRMTPESDSGQARMTGAAIYQYNNIAIVEELIKQKSLPENLTIPLLIERMTRGLSPWPGVWTLIETRDKTERDKGQDGKGQKAKKRFKILSCHLSPEPFHLILDQVQLEGKKPVSFKEFNAAYNILDNA